ncbi:MAG TPA: aspartate kinase [Candidatus Saccharimonadales bacterium]|nr:aspartate kinase [Candidatus Saccharimonadales bacterium]
MPGSGMNLIVMKFGGTSIGSAERMRNVAKIVADAHKNVKPVVVVSAMSTVTDLLLSAANNASNGRKSKTLRDLERLETIHLNTISDLNLGDETSVRLHESISGLLSELGNLLDSILVMGELTGRARDKILSFGERMSIQLVASALEADGIQAKPIEATKLIVTTDTFGDARPILEESLTAKTKINKLTSKNIVPVVTGFIGATHDGITTTLGRGGSDYSATILGNCIDADEVWIYTDVDGAMTADPRIIPEAKTIPELSYAEAAELSYFGAKVLHPLTMVPASLKDIPIRVKNTFNPDAPGTKISNRKNRAKNGCKAISSMNRLSLITVQGQGMTGVPGIAAKVFGTIAAQQINVLFISQASSEYNISLVVRHDDGEKAVRVLREAFEAELARRNIESVKLEENLAIIAVVGDNMQGHPGAAGKTFSALGNAGVNVVAIAQGSSELNISLVVNQTDVPVAVQSIHNEFKLAGRER